MKYQSAGAPRRAIILAAGDGGRLAGFTAATPKPLVLLGERPIIEYTLDAVRAAGIHEVLVVTGYREAQVRAGLARHARDFELSFASNPEYTGGASLSLRAAREFGAAGPALLLMADHLLGAELLQVLVETYAALPAGSDVSLVAADGSERDIVYTDEATKLSLSPGPAPRRVTAIGKDLPCWDAFDTGAFLLGPAAWEALDAAPHDCELSDVFRLLVARGKLLAADVSGMRWYDIDTPADLAAAGIWLTSRLAAEPGLLR